MEENAEAGQVGTSGGRRMSAGHLKAHPRAETDQHYFRFNSLRARHAAGSQCLRSLQTFALHQVLSATPRISNLSLTGTQPLSQRQSFRETADIRRVELWHTAYLPAFLLSLGLALAASPAAAQATPSPACVDAGNALGQMTKQLNRLSQYVDATHDRETGLELASHINGIMFHAGSIGHSIENNCQDLNPSEVADFRQMVRAFDDAMTAKSIPSP
jgi:hypothetical protein